MNLTITPNFQILASGQKYNTNSRCTQHSNLNVLSADTVSFTARKNTKESTNVIAEAIQQSYLSQVGKFIESAKNFHIGLKKCM